ncbi:MAG: ammonia-forming cytochrome c nitrite reductase subunit c552 [Gammaproteobacteria bacterium]|nr:ammonia-forming cytochrome c nitrite reductase subunit c552 [Gammaproteobacteria bacterium]
MKREIVFVAVLMTALTLAACTSGSTSTTVKAPVTTSTAAPTPSTTTTATTTTAVTAVALRTDCETCHTDIHETWTTGSHADTQQDVATELGEERAGQTPDDVIHGDDPENCIACHAPTAGATLNGVEALRMFFTTTDGVFTSDTAAKDASEWPAVTCTACHEVADDHPQESMPVIAAFDATTASYTAVGGASELCGQCHGTLRFPETDHLTYDDWKAGSHADTQADVAGELASERAGETPVDVISGDDPENCIACHGPSAVLANGGMSEQDAMAYFFTTDNGQFSSATTSAHSEEWPSVGCVSCHNPHNPRQPALLDSSTGEYLAMSSSSQLCGQCHGSLRFATDHLTFDAWSSSSHAATQADVAGELASERAGETPVDVISGDDPENCIACHGPTAVLANGGMSEADALAYFFTTDGGQFGDATAPDHASEWPSVGCSTCHDPHNPTQRSLFESASGEYVVMADDSQLCGQCHGNLRFPDTDHLSYNVLTGTGGIGVPDIRTMPGATCTSCHMYTSDVDGSNSSMQHGHTWAIITPEANGGTTASCSQCHTDFSSSDVEAKITAWQDAFQSLDAVVAGKVAAASEAMVDVDDADLQAKLDEAETNLALAEGDESGGFHNHEYLMALLRDAQARAEEVLSDLGK